MLYFCYYHIGLSWGTGSFEKFLFKIKYLVNLVINRVGMCFDCANVAAKRARGGQPLVPVGGTYGGNRCYVIGCLVGAGRAGGIELQPRAG